MIYKTLSPPKVVHFVWVLWCGDASSKASPIKRGETSNGLGIWWPTPNRSWYSSKGQCYLYTLYKYKNPQITISFLIQFFAFRHGALLPLHINREAYTRHAYSFYIFFLFSALKFFFARNSFEWRLEGKSMGENHIPLIMSHKDVVCFGKKCWVKSL